MAKFRSRGTKDYTHMVCFDIWQRSEEDLCYIEGPRAVADLGIGYYNFQLVPDPEAAGTPEIEIYVTQDDGRKIISEFQSGDYHSVKNGTPPSTDAGQFPQSSKDLSGANWFLVGSYTADGSFIQHIPPTSYIAIKFSGGTGSTKGKVNFSTTA